MNKFLKKILNDILIEEKIYYKTISDGFIIVLKKNKQFKYINEFRFGLNNQNAGLLCDDKYAMYEVLKYHHIPVVDYKLIWHLGINKNKFNINKKIQEIEKYFMENKQHIVLKPNNGFAGKLVFNIQKKDEIKPAFLTILKDSSSIVVNPFYHIKNEHRVIILNNNCRLIYTKSLKKGEWQFNLSKGSLATKITDERLKKRLIKLAKKTALAINAKFLSVDIIEDYNSNLKVLEINSGVCMEKYCLQHPEDYMIVKDIYRDAIKDIFK